MPFMTQGFTAFVLVIIGLIAFIVLRPEVLRARGGKVLAFIAFFALPGLASVGGLTAHMEQSKTTQFCLSCHVMEKYGQSLHLDDPSFVPAAHFQNGRIDREHACFTCHTTYTLFGDYKAKAKGLKHLYVNYIGKIPEKIELYETYRNRECLHCHGGARSFEEQSDHADIRHDLETNSTACTECHSPVHDVEHLAGAKMWQGQEVKK